jgi:hypothetical protein
MAISLLLSSPPSGNSFRFIPLLPSTYGQRTIRDNINIASQIKEPKNLTATTILFLHPPK